MSNTQPVRVRRAAVALMFVVAAVGCSDTEPAGDGSAPIASVEQNVSDSQPDAAPSLDPTEPVDPTDTAVDTDTDTATATTTTGDPADTLRDTSPEEPTTTDPSATTTDPTTTTSVDPTTTTSPPDDGAPPLRRGAEGELVSFWQDGLNGWLDLIGSTTFPIAVDGIFGPRTESATREFQDSSDRVESDGVVDSDDRVALTDAVELLEAIADTLGVIDVESGSRDDNATIFGVAPVGDTIDVDAAIAAIDEVLGAPSDDTGWLPMPTEELPCKLNTEHREVVWSDLRISFERGSGGATIGAWNLGRTTMLAPASPPLSGRSGVTTLEGIGVGSPRSALSVYESALDSRFVVASGPMPVGFDLVEDRVVSISSGPLDCLDPDELR